MESLPNHWVIGIGGGIVCGLLVLVIIRQLFNGREHRSYERRVTTANNEIIHAIRPAITEKVIPSGAMLDALFSATARKYGVSSKDLLPKAGFANELIKEVIDNTFLSSQQKIELCDLLAGLKQPEGDPSSRRVVVEVVSASRRWEAFDPSPILALTAGLMALTMTLFFHFKDKETFLLDGLLTKVFPMLAVVSIVPIVAFLVFDLARQTSRPRRSEMEKEEPAPKPSTPAPLPRDVTQIEFKPLPSTPQA
jgi:hypothetical protein